MSEPYSKPTLNFLLLTVIWVVALTLVELIAGRIPLHVTCNSFHSSVADSVFPVVTHLGSGWIFIVASLLLVFVQLRWAAIMLVANLISSGVAQGLKKLVFADMLRPSAMIQDLYLVPGVELHANHSFPSGHSATIFTIGLVLAFGVKSRKLSALIFVLCCIIAFSRVYLSQHFIGDVAFGSLIGILSALVAKSVLDRRFPTFGFFKLPK